MKHHGFAIVSILPLITIIWSLCTFITFYKINIARNTYYTRTHSLNVITAKNSSLQMLTNDNSDQIPTSPQYYNPPSKLIRKIESFGTVANNFPLIDWANTAPVQPTCTVAQPSRHITLNGFMLTPSSLVAKFTCNTLTPTAGTLSVQSNITINQVEFSAPSSRLLVLGYFDANIISIQHDLAIIAAGDIHINSITGSTLNSSKLTLYSATGAVVVDNLTNINLYVTSKDGSYLPSGITPSSINPLELPLLLEQTLGFTK